MTSDLTSGFREYVVDRHLRITVLTRGDETEGRHDIVRGVAGPGMATALHTHTRYEERLWVIAGELIVYAGPDEVSLGSGDFYTVRRNVPHMLRSGPNGAEVLNISSPAAFAQVMERTATPAHLAGPDTDLDLERFMQVTTELGDLVLGPPGTTPAALVEDGDPGTVSRIHDVPPSDRR